MSQATAHTVTVGQIVADNGEAFPDDVYTETSRATGNQQWVADAWAEGKLPTHSVSGDAVKLYTSTRNFEGYQYTDGRGKLKHYAHIQAIRTRSGLVVADNECYGKGWAHCNTPRDKAGSLPLTSLKDELRGDHEDIYDIVSISDDEATFESGRVFDTDSWGWVEDSLEVQGSPSPLGR
jgi:hypothetical protein